MCMEGVGEHSVSRIGDEEEDYNDGGKGDYLKQMPLLR